MFNIENDEDHQLAINYLLRLMEIDYREGDKINGLIDDLAKSIHVYEIKVCGEFNDKP